MNPIVKTPIINLSSTRALMKVHIDSLISSEVTAIIIDNVISQDSAASYSRKVRDLCLDSQYLWKADLTSTAPRSVGEAHESPEHAKEYFLGANRSDQKTRALIYDGVSPVDRIVDRVMSVWDSGVTVPHKGKYRYLSEISRRWKMHGGAHPHIDQRSTHLLSSLNIKDRLGLNVYLNMPPEGGEIEFWNHHITDEEYASLKRPDYGIDRTILKAPDLTIRPSIGQGIIFRADMPHAVASINLDRSVVHETEDRITNACFLCVTKSDEPILRFA